jgi:energy-coupling factor transport system ATP-binding protein
MTVIHITHFMEEIVAADRIIVLDKGKVVMEGEPRMIFRQVKRLKEIGLDVPQMTELAYELRNEGLKIDDDVLSIEEMVNALCQ